MTKRVTQTIVTAFLLLVAAPIIIQACGAFFGVDGSMDQSAERIIYAMNDDETITGIIGISYEGEASEFSWLLPVPSFPEVDVAENRTLSVLQRSTQKEFIEPNNYCRRLVGSTGGMGGGMGGFGSVGPYDFIILEPDGDPENIIRWLREGGYNIPEASEPAIAHYVEQGMYFLAMKLNKDADIGDIQPVKVTFEGTQPMIPIQLAAAASVENLPLFVWILGETQYAPENFTHAQIDYSVFDARSEITNIRGRDYGATTFDYQQQIRALQDEHAGQMFITEYAAPTRELSAALEDENAPQELSDLLADYPYITRLRGQMSPEQMTVDPVFSAAPDLPDVSRIVDLREHVDSLHYYGCGSRKLNRPENVDELLPNQLRITNSNYGTLTFGYPADWALTTLVEKNPPEIDYELHVVAPQTVTREDVIARINGENDINMMLLTDLPTNSNSWSGNYPRDTILNYFEIAPSTYEAPDNLEWRTNLATYLFQDRPYDIPEALNVHQALLLEPGTFSFSDPDNLYGQMLAYPDDYAYVTSPDLVHTLFINMRAIQHFSPLGNFLQAKVGYPAGWVEYIEDDTMQIYFLPEGSDDMDEAIYVDLRPMTAFGDWEVANKVIGDTYNLEDAETKLSENIAPGCLFATAPHAFERGDERGYVVLPDSGLMAAVYATGDAPDEILQQIAAAIEPGWTACG